VRFRALAFSPTLEEYQSGLDLSPVAGPANETGASLSQQFNYNCSRQTEHSCGKIRKTAKIGTSKGMANC
jgi:hypothetical protein